MRAIPGNNSISINFWSGILASDFAGFNLYISDSPNFTNALLNNSGGYPTISFSTHARSNITLKFPDTSIQNDILYYVSVTAYGTNDLAEGGKIETRRDSVIPVVPRAEATGTGTTATINAGTLNITINTTTISGGKIQSYGVQSNFDAITVFTNNNITTTSQSYTVGGVYIASNNTDLCKVWITSSGYTYATHSQAGKCNTI